MTAAHSPAGWRRAQLCSRLRLRVACVVFCLAVCNLLRESIQQLQTEQATETFSTRHTLSFTLYNCTPAAISQFPRDFFSQDATRSGAVAVHILVATYMFLALAVVCDDYFVPSLQRISEALNLQQDVAGATFMAAGSSAPEMATTLIGVFVAEDDIGLGAIVGSAVFNIMFVVSVCALATTTVVYLNFWPLFRDCIFYAISILALVIVIGDGHVYWYEGVLFMALYALYILLMYFNRPLERFALQHSCRCLRVPDEWYVQERNRSAAFPVAGNVKQEAQDSTTDCRTDADAPKTTRFGAIDMLSEQHNESAHSSDKSGHSLLDNDNDNVFTARAFHSSWSDDASSADLSNARHALPVAAASSTQNAANVELENDPDYHVVFSSNADGQEDCVHLLSASDSTDFSSGLAKRNQRSRRNKRSLFMTLCACACRTTTRVDNDKQCDSSDDEMKQPQSDNHCCSPCKPPKGCWKRFIWFLSLPISLLLFVSVPDCREQRWRNWFWLTFTVSVVWIGAFSYVMVWMIAIIGYTFDIADSIMGITFIAAGASIPDLLASLIVVREGEGDMAISNAVGSNVFDILVCLGVPWLLQSVMSEYRANGIPVYSAGLVYSTLTLFGTVVLFIAITWLNGWKMDFKYGVVLMVMYVVFVIIASLSELNYFGYVHPPTCLVSIP